LGLCKSSVSVPGGICRFRASAYLVIATFIDGLEKVVAHDSRLLSVNISFLLVRNINRCLTLGRLSSLIAVFLGLPR
jgi:hypothetical protein